MLPTVCGARYADVAVALSPGEVHLIAAGRTGIESVGGNVLLIGEWRAVEHEPALSGAGRRTGVRVGTRGELLAAIYREFRAEDELKIVPS